MSLHFMVPSSEVKNGQLPAWGPDTGWEAGTPATSKMDWWFNCRRKGKELLPGNRVCSPFLHEVLGLGQHETNEAEQRASEMSGDSPGKEACAQGTVGR